MCLCRLGFMASSGPTGAKHLVTRRWTDGVSRAARYWVGAGALEVILHAGGSIRDGAQPATWRGWPPAVRECFFICCGESLAAGHAYKARMSDLH